MRILIISGLFDLELVGGQSLRNTVEGFVRNGHTVDLISMFPEGFDNIVPSAAAPTGVTVRRLPGALVPLMRLAKSLKNIAGHWGAISDPSRESVEYEADYLDEYNVAGRLLYIVYQYAICLPVQAVRILLKLRALRPDLLYGLNAHGAVVASLLGRLIKRPVVTRFYGVPAPDKAFQSPLWMLWYFDEVAPLKMKADLVVLTDDGSRGAEKVSRFGVDPAKIRSWMNGFDPTDLKPPLHPDKSAAKARLRLTAKHVFFMCSRLERCKRVDRGIRLFHEVSKLLDEDTCMLLIAGQGPEQQKLEELDRELDGVGKVEFLGGVPHGHLSMYYSASDVFLNFYDGANLGNPVIEALSFGLPIASIANGSTDALLEDGRNAILLRTDELLQQGAPRIADLVSTPGRLAQYSEAAREAFQHSVLTWQRRMDVEVDELERLVAAKSN